MDSPSLRVWVDHEFVVKVNKHDDTQTHRVYIMDSGDLVIDEVTNGENKAIRTYMQTAEKRWETELDADGKPLITREVKDADGGQKVTHEEATSNTLHTERFTTTSRDGKVVTLLEKLYCGTQLQNQAETHYNTDGAPSVTINSYYDKKGSVSKREQITWHRSGQPAITELSEYNSIGITQHYVKTMHSVEGQPVWQEKLYYLENTAKPSKKEMIVFSKTNDRALVDTSEFAEDGTVKKHEMTSVTRTRLLPVKS